MTALSDNRPTSSRGELRIRSYDVAASVTIYAGGMVMIDSAGYARPAGANDTNLGVVGVAKEKVDNSSGSAQDKEVICQMGSFRFAATSVEMTSMNARLYATDDQTVDETDATNRPVAGVLEERLSATDVWIRIDGGLNAALPA